MSMPRTITLHATVGSTVTIELPENPSTGYSWTIEQLDAAQLAISADRFVGPATPLPGAPGTRHLEITLLQPGTARLTLAAVQPWIGAEASTARRHYTFHIAAGEL